MNFKEGREHRLDAFSESWINEDFALLYDVNTSKNWVFYYWEYDPFDLDAILKMKVMQYLDFWKMTLRDWERHCFNETKQLQCLQWSSYSFSQSLMHFTPKICMPQQIFRYDFIV